MKTFFAITLAAFVGMANASPIAGSQCIENLDYCTSNDECCGNSVCQWSDLDPKDSGLLRCLKISGEPCQFGTQCADGYGCALFGAAGEETGMCYPAKKRINFPCKANTECMSERCDTVCKPRSATENGETCPYDMMCKSGFCDPRGIEEGDEWAVCNDLSEHPYKNTWGGVEE
eukprot:Clim_evm61s199 gene=Clim_evmTU61s199